MFRNDSIINLFLKIGVHAYSMETQINFKYVVKYYAGLPFFFVQVFIKNYLKLVVNFTDHFYVVCLCTFVVIISVEIDWKRVRIFIKFSQVVAR